MEIIVLALVIVLIGSFFCRGKKQSRLVSFPEAERERESILDQIR
jgi:hypothetical protein